MRTGLGYDRCFAQALPSAQHFWGLHRMIYRTLLKFWLLPPMLNIVLIVLGLLLMLRFKRLGIASCLAGVLSLLVLSIPQCANWLLKSIEVAEAVQVDSLIHRPLTAIVVLGAGHHEISDEYGMAYPNRSAVARLNYAAYLHAETELPILLTGGKPDNSHYVHAAVMAEYLRLHFQIDAQWLEGRSRTTYENASFSQAILSDENINTVVLVTESVHMRRSILLFESAGFNVIPAPTELAEPLSPVMQLWRWLPNTEALTKSKMVIHEVLGYWWYKIVL